MSNYYAKLREAIELLQSARFVASVGFSHNQKKYMVVKEEKYDNIDVWEKTDSQKSWQLITKAPAHVLLFNIEKEIPI